MGFHLKRSTGWEPSGSRELCGSPRRRGRGRRSSAPQGPPPHPPRATSRRSLPALPTARGGPRCRGGRRRWRAAGDASAAGPGGAGAGREPLHVEGRNLGVPAGRPRRAGPRSPAGEGSSAAAPGARSQPASPRTPPLPSAARRAERPLSAAAGSAPARRGPTRTHDPGGLRPPSWPRGGPGLPPLPPTPPHPEERRGRPGRPEKAGRPRPRPGPARARRGAEPGAGARSGSLPAAPAAASRAYASPGRSSPRRPAASSRPCGGERARPPGKEGCAFLGSRLGRACFGKLI